MKVLFHENAFCKNKGRWQLFRFISINKIKLHAVFLHPNSPRLLVFWFQNAPKNRFSTLSLMFSHSMSSATSQLNSTFGSSACGHSTSIRYWLLSWLVAKIQSINLLAQTRKCKLKNREIRNIYGISFVYFSVWLLLITPRDLKTSLTKRQDIVHRHRNVLF